MNLPSCVAAEPACQALSVYARQHRLTLTDLADVLDLPDLDIRRDMQRRWLPWPLADRVAVALGHHPWELWPDWFDITCESNSDRDTGVPQ